MRIGKVASLVAVLVWFYLFSAVVLNPTFDPSSVPGNPLIPFLSAATVALFWPLILISTPIVFVAGGQLVKPSGLSRREISPEEFIRIQSRAIRMREADEQRANRSRSPSVSSVPRTAPLSAVTEPAEAPTEKEIIQEAARPASTETKESEFTLPPLAPRETAPKESLTAEQGMATPPVRQELEVAAHLGPVDKFKDVIELEAEKGAVLSLVEKLEEMSRSGTIKRKLYEKLKGKYGEQMGKIDARIKELLEKKVA